MKHLQQLVAKKPIYSILLTGGPCSGKTSSLNFLKTEVERCGYKVLTAPEVATIIYGNGAEWATQSADVQCDTVKVSIKLQEQMEDCFNSLASLAVEEAPNNKHDKKGAVVFIDRGLLDNKPFMSAAHWQSVLQGM